MLVLGQEQRTSIPVYYNNKWTVDGTEDIVAEQWWRPTTFLPHSRHIPWPRGDETYASSCHECASSCLDYVTMHCEHESQGFLHHRLSIQSFKATPNTHTEYRCLY